MLDVRLYVGSGTLVNSQQVTSQTHIRQSVLQIHRFYGLRHVYHFINENIILQRNED